MNVQDLRESLESAVANQNRVGDEVEAALRALPAGASEAEMDRLTARWDSAKEETERRRANLERAEGISTAYRSSPPIVTAGGGRERSFATARGQHRVEGTYRPDTGPSFFADLYRAQALGDPDARERVERSHRESMAALATRATTSTTAGGFSPPTYLGEFFAEYPRPARPFADAVPKLDLPDTGQSIVVPRLTTGTSVASQSSQNATVSSTDFVETDLSVTVQTLAGQMDLSRQSLERTQPGLDFVIWQDLQNAYDAQLDTQLLSGNGSTQHVGIRNVSSVNTATASTPTGISVASEIYSAVSQIASTRYRTPDLVVMHPRRAAFLAQSVSTSFPLFQQGGLFQSFGQQDGGLLSTFAGMRVVLDPNIGITYGAGTNQDEIYVLHSPDLALMESPIRSLRFDDVGSGNLTIRLQVFAYSGWVSGRFPSAITVISGAGLATPAFG